MRQCLMLKFRSNLNLLAVKLTLNIYFHDSNLLPSPIWDIFPRIPGRAWCNCGTVIRLIRLGVLRHTVRTRRKDRRRKIQCPFSLLWDGSIRLLACRHVACGMLRMWLLWPLSCFWCFFVCVLWHSTSTRVGRWKVKKCWNLVFETKHTEEWVVL